MIDALKQELSHGDADREFTAAELAAIDHIHTRGFASTVELAKKVGITPHQHVLDIGAGLGGPARYLAETFGCQVECIDLTPGLVQAAEYLSSRWSGPKERVTFSVGDATALPYPDHSFDLVWMQHVAMNIADRDVLYREIRRVLRPGGTFATYDVLRANGDLIYPTPWAKDQSVSTVLTADETRAAIEKSGMRVRTFELDTPAALEWVRSMANATSSNARPPGSLMMRAALGENFREVVGNLGKNYLEGRADVATIIAES
jgi:ubiquinone/menaquinone biosynthesis C-methylase UbiE